MASEENCSHLGRGKRAAPQEFVAMSSVFREVRQSVAARCAEEFNQRQAHLTLRELRKLLARCCADTHPVQNFDFHYFILLRDNVASREAVREAEGAEVQKAQNQPHEVPPAAADAGQESTAETEKSKVQKKQPYEWSEVEGQVEMVSWSESQRGFVAEEDAALLSDFTQYWKFSFRYRAEILKPAASETPKPQEICVYHAVPETLTSPATLQPVLDNLKKESPDTHRALCALAFAIKHKEAVLLEGPGSSGKSTLVELLAFLLQGPRSFTSLPCSASTTLQDLLGSVEPHNQKTFCAHVRAWLHKAEGKNTNKEQKETTAWHDNVEDLKLRLEVLEKEGSTLVRVYSAHLRSQLQKQKGQSFPFLDRGLMPSFRLGGFVLLRCGSLKRR